MLLQKRLNIMTREVIIKCYNRNTEYCDKGGNHATTETTEYCDKGSNH